MKPLSLSEALSKAAARCSRAEHCVSEVRTWLQRWEVSDADAEEIVRRLKADRFIDDERYVKAFIHDKMTYDRWGRKKIVYALKVKQLPDEVVRRCMAAWEEDESYSDRLLQLLQAKSRSMSFPLSMADKAKLYRFAASRGYESSLVSDALRRLERSGADAD